MFFPNNFSQIIEFRVDISTYRRTNRGCSITYAPSGTFYLYLPKLCNSSYITCRASDVAFCESSDFQNVTNTMCNYYQQNEGLTDHCCYHKFAFGGTCSTIHRWYWPLFGCRGVICCHCTVRRACFWCEVII